RGFTGVEPRNLAVWLRHAALCLKVGDSAEYRKLCRRMYERSGRSTKVHEVALLAHTCVLAPDALEDGTAVLELAQRRMTLATATAWHTQWSGHVLGLANYRIGHFEQAIEFLGKDLSENPVWENRVANWLVLAMAHHRLNHPAEARQWLDRARQWARQN